MDFRGGAGTKNPLANAGDIRGVGSIPGSVRSPGERNGNLLLFSSLENLMDRGPWWVAKSQTQLRNWAHIRMHIYYVY